MKRLFVIICLCCSSIQYSCNSTETINKDSTTTDSVKNDAVSHNESAKQTEAVINDSTNGAKLTKIPGFSFEAFSKKLRSLGFKSGQKCYPDLETGKETCEWNFDLDSHQNHYNITAFGKTKTSIEQVEILGTYNSTSNDETMKMFDIVASIPYDKADPQKAIAWERKNFSIDKTETTIGGIKFKMFAKSSQGTFLTVSIDE